MSATQSFHTDDQKFNFFQSITVQLHSLTDQVEDEKNFSKVEKILKGSLDSIPSPSPWVGKFA